MVVLELKVFAPIKERQYEKGVVLTTRILKSLEVIEAILRDKPKRQFFIFPPPCLRFVGASDAALECPGQGTGGFLYSLDESAWGHQGGFHRRLATGGIYPVGARRPQDCTTGDGCHLAGISLQTTPISRAARSVVH